MTNIKNTNLVRFDDKLVYHGSYQLSAKAIKTLCYIAAKYVDPKNMVDLPRPIFVSLNELSIALSDGRAGFRSNSLYETIESLCEELVTAKIRFKSDVKVEGKDLHGYVSWCADAVPEKRDGVPGINFTFGIYMSQFLINLSRYVALYRPELNRLNSGYSIRLFQILKGIYNKKQKYRKVFREVYAVDQLRYLMAVEDKYKDFRFFNRDILKSAVREINQNTSIFIIDLIKIRRAGRKTTHLEFVFTENKKGQAEVPQFDPKQFVDFVPKEKDLKTLTYAEYKAYELLLDFHIKPGIAFKQILPEIGGSEVAGFEDYFITAALDHFRATARNQQNPSVAAATFVKWWVKLRVFDTTSEVWTKIHERVIQSKKSLQKSNPQAFDNRLHAREMTHEEFKIWWEENSMVQ